jgi:glycosyltransferase involved in cell wall biosynthesis
MRAVFLTHNYPRHDGDMAGGFLHPLARALRDRDIDVRVVAPSDAGRGGRDVLDGVPVHRVRYAAPSDEILAYRGTMAGAVRTAGGLRTLAALVRAFTRGATEELAGGGGVVHAHWWFPAGMAAPAIHPMVVTCHGTDIRLLETSRFARILGRRVLRRAQVVTTVSHHLAEVVRRRTGRSIPEDCIQGMPVAEVARPRSVGGGGVVVVGRLTPQKRLDLTFEAVALLRREGHDVTLTLVGDGPERARLQVLAGALGIAAATRFVGTVAPDQVPEWLATADACVATAHDEGLGLSAAEALMQGVPVVACDDGGGLLDLVPTSAGGRVVAPDPVAIAGALRQVLDDPHQSDAAWAHGERWRTALAPGAVAERCIAWYQRALGG